jgi:hypothetical protein
LGEDASLNVIESKDKSEGISMAAAINSISVAVVGTEEQPLAKDENDVSDEKKFLLDHEIEKLQENKVKLQENEREIQKNEELQEGRKELQDQEIVSGAQQQENRKELQLGTRCKQLENYGDEGLEIGQDRQESRKRRSQSLGELHDIVWDAEFDFDGQPRVYIVRPACSSGDIATIRKTTRKQS